LSVSFADAQQARLVAADSLRAAGNLQAAATAYERAYFSAGSGGVRVQALFGRAACFKALGRYYEAYRSLARIHGHDPDDSTRCAANYELALNLYLAGYYNDAVDHCEKNFSIPVSTREYAASYLVHGFAANELNRYKAAEESFKQYLSLSALPASRRDSLTRWVTSYYQKDNLPRIKSLRKARRLSKVLPGAGLFYAGKPGRALANIGFLLLSAGYTGANVYAGNYITSASAGLYLLRAFYTGGINQLNEVVPAQNQRRTTKFNGNFKERFIPLIK
jgi:tetratricopeptide (TPR) repeat protein